MDAVSSVQRAVGLGVAPVPIRDADKIIDALRVVEGQSQFNLTKVQGSSHLPRQYRVCWCKAGTRSHYGLGCQ